MIKNQTHGQLNGRLTITNSLDNEEFIFEEEDEELEEEEERDVKEIVIESSSYKISNSLTIAIICISIMLL